MAQVSSDRNHTLDAFRAVASFAVVWIHSNKWIWTGDPVWSTLGKATFFAGRAAVPFFFVAGWLFARRIARCGDPMAAVRRAMRTLFPLYAVWWVIYFFVLSWDMDLPGSTYRAETLKQIAFNWHRLRTEPLELLIQGTKGHLWFLPSLMFGILILGLLERGRARRFAAALVVPAVAYAVLAGGWKDTPLGIHPPFKALLQVCYGYPMLWAGMLFFRRPELLPRARWSLALGFGGIALLSCEIIALNRLYQTPTIDGWYHFGRFVAGIGFGCLALRLSRLSVGPVLPWIGRRTNLIYAMHMAWIPVVRLAIPVNKEQPLMDPLFTCIVFGLCLLSAWCWEKVRPSLGFSPKIVPGTITDDQSDARTS